MESIYKMDNIDNIYQTDATEEKEDEEEAVETDEGGTQVNMIFYINHPYLVR